MGGPNIWEEQRNFVKNLHEQGILDSRFDEILDLPRENPQFVIDLVTKFCSDAENSIAALIRYLNEPDINYPKVIDRAHQIKGASSCIGGHRMALASRELRYACEDKDKDRCFAAFCKTKDEYQILKEKFNIILQVMLRKKNYQPYGEKHDFLVNLKKATNRALNCACCSVR